MELPSVPLAVQRYNKISISIISFWINVSCIACEPNSFLTDSTILLLPSSGPILEMEVHTTSLHWWLSLLTTFAEFSSKYYKWLWDRGKEEIFIWQQVSYFSQVNLAFRDLLTGNLHVFALKKTWYVPGPTMGCKENYYWLTMLVVLCCCCQQVSSKKF